MWQTWIQDLLIQDQDQDSEVPRPGPRSRLVKTGLETSRDPDSSLKNSKSAMWEIERITLYAIDVLNGQNEMYKAFRERVYYGKYFKHL